MLASQVIARLQELIATEGDRETLVRAKRLDRDVDRIVVLPAPNHNVFRESVTPYFVILGVGQE